MSVAMKRHSFAKIGNRDRWRSKPDRKLARAIMATWPHSAEAFQIDIADPEIMGGEENTIHISVRTANNWRSGETGPSDSDGQKIRRAIKTITEQQIAAAYARLEAIRNE